ncbi:hypothetical protein [Rhodobacter maris]|uniref:Lipoprotein n=1 Tax=Rhodobacter maris TaxID=446682 RepID=A0A285SRH0_9RHOB|nr:hypothetical protein [Rhodobacter maris]SOC10288.1 hypothetical protein SAMN05877831_10843 [Rhodobacter maris]
MPRALILAACVPGLLAGLGACAPAGAGAGAEISYEGVETRLLDNDLVGFDVAIGGSRNRAQVTAYATCAAAQYALIRGYGFARHVRTNVTRAGTGLRADAIYLISSALPEGLRTIDAEVTVADCRERGIPTV